MGSDLTLPTLAVTLSSSPEDARWLLKLHNTQLMVERTVCIAAECEQPFRGSPSLHHYIALLAARSSCSVKVSGGPARRHVNGCRPGMERA